MITLLEKAQAIVQSYTRELRGFWEARDPGELRAWFADEVRQGSGFGFNGDVLRARIVAELYRVAGCTAFVETGTFRGTTTILAARLFGGRVWSCELNRRSWFISRIRCLPYKRISIVREDSRRFLRGMANRLGPSDIPMFYLDAHWNTDLPLREEVGFILRTWSRCIVVVDDFAVPGQPGFKYDIYGDEKLSLELLGEPSDIAALDADVHFPAYAPEMDTGARCGYVVLAKGLGGHAIPGRFPLDRLKRYE